MKRAWSSKYEKCQECGTQRRSHRAKGLCIRCYQLVYKLKQIEQWDLTDPQTLKGFPRVDIFWEEKTFNQAKRGAAKEVRRRLDFLKYREESLQEPVTGIDIEYFLQYIADRCGVRNKNLFHGIAGTIDFSFDMEQKKIIYELLNRIEEDIPWRAIDWIEVVRAINWREVMQPRSKRF